MMATGYRKSEGWCWVAVLLLGGGVALAGAEERAGKPSVDAEPGLGVAGAARPAEPFRVDRVKVVGRFPHDRDAFTQGLFFHDGHLYEGTGLEGRSSLRKVDLASGRVLRKVDLEARYFGEGIVLLGETIYQLTWKHGVGFLYDAATFERRGTFRYEGEGWGLTTDGKSLILSDGTARLRFLDPETFAVRRTVEVRHAGRPVTMLNELEWVNGEIYSNVFGQDFIVRIDPKVGRVLGLLDLRGLHPPERRGSMDEVLNGIAWDEAGKRLFVTGKLWPEMYQIEIIPPEK